MATYKVGKVKISATGVMTGAGTNWTAANALVRVGATVIIATNPARIYTVGQIISATSIQLSDFGSDAAITADTNYAILLHDGLTVQGLAQDTAETLRYYRNFEQTLGDASKMNVGEKPGDLMKVGAFGLGVAKPGGSMGATNYPTANALMNDLISNGCGWWRAQAVSEAGYGIYGHGSSYASTTGDTVSAINVDYGTGKVIVLTDTTSNIKAGKQPRRNSLFGSANPPDINLETRGVLSVINGGTGGNSPGSARESLGVGIYALPTSGNKVAWFKIATLNDPGQGGSFKQFVLGGANGIGNPRMDISFLTISPRGITQDYPKKNMRLFITHKVLAGNTQDMNATVRFGITQAPGGKFDLWAKFQSYNDRMTFNLLASNGDAIKGFLDGDSAVVTKVDVEPDGIQYAEPDKIYDNWSIERDEITARGFEARYTPGDASVIVNRGRIRGTWGNGNLVIGTDNGDAPAGSTEATPSSIYIRQAGHLNSKVQTQYLPNGNVQSTGQFNGSSDIRLKKNFKPIKAPLEAMMKFRGATFTMINGGAEAVGIIAQDIKKECPEAIQVFETEVDGVELKDAMSVNSAGLAAAYSVEAIKEVVSLLDLLIEDPEAAKARIKALKGMINSELPNK